MSQHILVVEDEEPIRLGLGDLLERENYKVTLASTGDEGKHLALTAGADLVLLDIMLPGADGYEILKAMRDDNLETPVIFLSARGQEIDKVLGFTLGADDYVVKPFSTRELVMRVKARLKGAGKSMLQKFEFSGVILDLVASKLWVDGNEIDSTAKEKELLGFFLRHEGEALTREKILKEVWAYESSLSTRTIDSHVFSLRQKIEKDPKNPLFIQSVRNVGYRFQK